LREGATGDTKTALDQVLELADIGPHALQTAVLDLKSALQIHQPGLALTVANSLWCNRKCAPLPDYTAKAADEYDAEVFPLDPQSEGMVSTINSWVFQKTGGKIRNILSQIDPLASLLVLNAIYFKGLWDLPFDVDATKVDPFHSSDGRDQRLPFMTQYNSYPYYEESSFQVVRLDYKTSLLSMYVFLPALRSSLSDFLHTLDCNSWQKWMRRFDQVQGLVRLPRFELTCDLHLNGALEALGMGIAFDPHRARFDAIHPPPPEVYVSDVVHRAFVQVHEEGTKAAAFTGAIACFSSAQNQKPPRTFRMVVDRPFFFAITENHSGSILFMGSVEQP
jgi:serpin B